MRNRLRDSLELVRSPCGFVRRRRECRSTLLLLLQKLQDLVHLVIELGVLLPHDLGDGATQQVALLRPGRVVLAKDERDLLRELLQLLVEHLAQAARRFSTRPP